MFPSAYCQGIRGEFIELEYTPSTVDVDTLVTEYSKRIEEQNNGRSHTHVL
jgi:hypothetical protein